ncbi:AaceriAAR103Cp [[Ashbya] aceris (nom. inval.)]|nr:AaceriAAR103Cp [[Ashbya] aceris (nom. inval.)]
MPEVVDKLVFASGGKTLVTYQNDRDSLFAVNKNQLTKILQLNKPEDEPEILSTCNEPTSIYLCSDRRLLVTSANGDVHLYSASGKDDLLFRSPLPIRDCAAIHDETMCVVGGDDLELTFIELKAAGNKETLKLDEQVSQLSYSPHMNILAVTLVNGNIHFYSLTSATPNEVKKLEGYAISNFYSDSADMASQADGVQYCDENRICTRVSWHPRGLHFAIPCKDYTVKIFNLGDFSVSKTLTSGGASHFTNLLFDPFQGRYIAALDLTNNLLVWELNSGQLTYSKQLDYRVSNVCWKLDGESMHLLLGTWDGELLTVKDVGQYDRTAGKLVADEAPAQTKKPKNALFLDSDDENDSDVPPASPTSIGERGRDSISADIPTDTERGDENEKRTYNYEDDEQFIDDDDNAGYVPAKRKAAYIPSLVSNSKRPRTADTGPLFRYKPISPGGTPFGNSDKRYLTMNSIGYVWTVRGTEGQYSVTVSFFDVGRYREYHFEDLFGYDLCSLTDEGTFFGQSKTGELLYRVHSFNGTKWTKRIPLAPSEIITGIASTGKKLVVATSLGYIRTFNEHGLPLALEKMTPIVALAAQEHKIFAVHYSIYHGLSYSLFEQNPQTGSKYYQRECPLPLMLPSFSAENKYISTGDTFNEFNPIGIKSLFFSTFGDPCIFGYDNVLLVLYKWRNSMESRWVPIVDSSLEIWKLSGGKQPEDIHVWPLGLNYDMLNYILIKGKNLWPGFPLPLPSEMEIRLPLLDKTQILKNDASPDEEVVIPPALAAEEEFLRSQILAGLLADTLQHDGEFFGNENEILATLTGVRDKSLLRLFASACSDQNTEKALSLVKELKQDKALNAAQKIAERAELLRLVSSINDIRNSRFESELDNL